MGDGSGWRARIGGLLPADGDTDEELRRFLPAGASLHLTRVPVKAGDFTLDDVIAMADDPKLQEAAEVLCTIELDSLVYLCTSGSFVRGAGYDEVMANRLRQAAGVPATTTSTAMLVALRALSVNSVAILAPYAEEVTDRLVSFLQDNSFRVLASSAMGLNSGASIRGVSEEEVYRRVREADHPQAEAVFISCTGMITAGILDALEHDLGKPVLSANQVSMWHSLLLAGVRSPMNGLGRLYQIFP